MSSILKALKKLEDEKSIRKPDSLKIDAEILRGDVSRRFSPMGISLLAALLFVCGGAATYVFMKPDTRNNAGMNSPVSAVTSAGSPSSATSVAPVAEKTNHQNLQTNLQKSDKIISIKLDNMLTTPKMPEKTHPAQPINKPETTLNSVPAKKASATAIQPTAPAMTPSLKVNGIAYQNESADRVAIVNGVSVTNGSMIEGAKVEDIQKERVRFSYGGEKFDVTLGKSNQ